jgi:hypothetical protein
VGLLADARGSVGIVAAVGSFGSSGGPLADARGFHEKAGFVNSKF